MKLWSGQTGVAQAVLIAGLLIAVAFWSFVLTNLRPGLDQVFQGRWSRTGPIAVIARAFAGRHRQRRAEDMDADDRLEEIETMLGQAAEALPRPQVTGRPYTGDAENELQAIEDALAGTALLPVEEAAAALPEISARLSALAALLAGTETDTSLGRFTVLVTTATELVEQRLREVRTRRALIQQRLFLLYPDEPVDVVPTRIGNILLAAEQHPRIRYGLDPVVIWSRLQPLLPDAFAAGLKDAKASVDLMLTLATYLLVAGLPMAIWTAVHASLSGRPLLWTACAAVLIGACGLLRLRHRIIAATATTALLAIALVLICEPLTDAAGVESIVRRTAMAIAIVVGITTLSVGAYAGACEAALTYADQLRSAFDLHRRLVIQAMGLQAPESLHAERELWHEIGLFLYRGDLPLSPAYRYRPEGQQPQT
ncbi:hypothetical protein [Actinoallomurus rhizosphaericola]|uniref:hypothetical protein n=1 Tax=Actinoallomurus rhizosphaericola TaxID=2952536 RepID=UPI0020908776|nr:hypothetical protein [Actinoallomurus rhizosphaericola]MCO5994361.1 hypothetical protein [Actinoallomurus rhizosphaericola]